MRLNCLPVSLYPDFAASRRTLGDWFRLAAALGLDGADVSVAHLPDRRPAALDTLRQATTDADLPIVMLATYSDFTHPDPRERAGSGTISGAGSRPLPGWASSSCA